jgi:hypothetical protein
MSAGFGTPVTPMDWWLTQAKVLAMYLRLVFWPWPLEIYYDFPYLRTLSEAWPWLVPLILLLIGTAVAFRRRLAVGFVAAFAWVVLAPTTLVPIATEIAAERRMYLPLAALIVLVVVGVAAVIRADDRPRALSVQQAGIASFIVLALIAAGISARRVRQYQDPVVLWQETARRQPGVLALNNLGMVLNQAGRAEEAIAPLERVVEISPGTAEAHINLGIAHLKLGRYASAAASLERAIAIKTTAEAHLSFGVALSNLQRPDEAIAQFEKAAALRPDLLEAHYNRGVKLVQMGRPAQALAPLEPATSLLTCGYRSWFLGSVPGFGSWVRFLVMSSPHALRGNQLVASRAGARTLSGARGGRVGLVDASRATERVAPRRARW